MERNNSFIFKLFNFGIVAMSMAMVLSLSGCIEEFEADIPAADSDLLVVEGTICSGKLNKFTLTRTQDLKTPNTPGIVWGAMVSVRGSDGSEYIAQQADGYYPGSGDNYEVTGDYYPGSGGYYPGNGDYNPVTRGSYSCWIDALTPDVEYYLHIEVDGEVYESEPQKPLPTEKIAEVRGVQETPESNIDVLVTPAAPFDPDKGNYYSWTYDETWEARADYTTNIFYDIYKKTRVYKYNQFPERGWKDGTSSTVMIGASTNYEGQHIERLKLYDIDRSNERMYYRYSALVHQRAVSKAEYEYELAQRQADSEMGGLFTPQPSALPTNIRCLTSHKRVIGFVGCSLNTSEYRLFFNGKDFSIYHPIPKDARLWVENPTDVDCRMLVEKGMFLCIWEDKQLTEGKLITAWATEVQLDVRYKGAYIEKPDFWTDEDE